MLDLATNVQFVKGIGPKFAQMLLEKSITTVMAVAGLVREGKVRHAGVSNFNLAQLQRIQAVYPVASLQPPYSMLMRGVEAELLPWCAANHIGVIA